MPDDNNGMIENVETLLPWEPSKPIFGVFQYTHADASDGSGSEPWMGDPPNSIIEEPTSDDEMEYRRGVEHETEMDRILYGSPGIRPGPAITID